MFKVTGMQWGNVSPHLVIACNQPKLVGRKMVVIHVSTFDTLGCFEVIQITIDGYLMREEQISNPVWWGFLHRQMQQYAHPRIDDAVAILIH